MASLQQACSVGAAGGMPKRNRKASRHATSSARSLRRTTAACEAALVVHEILKRHNRTAPAATSASSSLASSSSSGASSGSGAVAFRDMAVLFRTNATGAAFQEALRRHGVPFKTQADQLYNMLEIEDVLAFLRIVTNEADDRAFLRVCKVLQCPIDAAVYGVLQQHQRAQRVSLLHAVRWLQAGGQALLNTVAVNALTAAAAPPHKKPKLGSSSSSSSSSSAKGKAGNGGGGGGSAGAKSALRGLKKVTDAIDTLKNRLEELNLAAFVRRCVDYHPWVKKRMHQLDAERDELLVPGAAGRAPPRRRWPPRAARRAPGTRTR